MTMQMLHAGGYPCAGEYPVFEPYKIGDIPWNSVKGKAVKLLDAHLHLPFELKRQKVILLTRDPIQQARSFNKFLLHIIGLPPVPESNLKLSFKKDYATISKWLKRHDVLKLQFEDIIKNPMDAAQKIVVFSGQNLSLTKMAAAVIPRDPECYPGFL